MSQWQIKAHLFLSISLKLHAYWIFSWNAKKWVHFHNWKVSMSNIFDISCTKDEDIIFYPGLENIFLPMLSYQCCHARDIHWLYWNSRTSRQETSLLSQSCHRVTLHLSEWKNFWSRSGWGVLHIYGIVRMCSPNSALSDIWIAPFLIKIYMNSPLFTWSIYKWLKLL